MDTSKKIHRRQFLGSSLALGTLPFATFKGREPAREQEDEVARRLRIAMETPVLHGEIIPHPVLIESVDLIKNGLQFIVRVRSKDGAEGFAIANRKRMNDLYPIFVNRVAKYAVGKDARELERIIREIYLTDLNYKWQGVPFWICVAVFEFAALDLLGRVSGKPVGDLLGGVLMRDIGIYGASGRRGNTARQEIEYLQKIISETGAKAVKYRLGGRMWYDENTRKRDGELIPLSRKVLGDDFTIYVDANGSFDIPEAIRMGKILESHKISFFEEPCPFDYYEETKAVADALTIPIAGGEEESSLRQFRYMIEHDVVQLVQPDPLYFGGLIRSIKVARMAQVVGMTATPHMSGLGFGYLYVLHYASCVPNAGPYQEYKGDDDPIPFECATSRLKPENGIMRVPSGPGLGIDLDPGFVRKGRIINDD